MIRTKAPQSWDFSMRGVSKSQKTGSMPLPFSQALIFSSMGRSIFRLLLSGICLLGLSACTQGGLKLIRQLEARALKSRILAERDMCFFDFVREDDFKRCYEEGSTRLVAEECVTIRQTEPVLQRDCEDFLYRIVMKPDSMFPGSDAGFKSKYRIDDELNPDAVGENSRPGGCIDNADCRAKCSDFFSSASDRRACYAYSASAVAQMEKVFTAFKDPTTSRLNGLNLRYVRVVLNISIDDTLAQIDPPWDEDEKKAFLTWLATKTKTSSLPSAAKVFHVAEIFQDTHQLSEFLFPDTGGPSTVVEILNKSLTSQENGNSFIDRLLVSRNGEGLFWLHEYLSYKYDSSDSSSGKAEIFKDIYCAMDFNSKNDEKYFSYGFFLDLLDNILEQQRRNEEPGTGNTPEWWKENTIARDLSSDQWWQPHVGVEIIDSDSDPANDLDPSEAGVCGAMFGGPGIPLPPPSDQ